MTTKKIARIKKLVNVKKRNVDLAGIAVSSVRAKQAKKEDEVEEAKRKQEESLKKARNVDNQCVCAEDLALNAECVNAATCEIEKETELLTSIETELNKQTDQLLSVHKELKQMESLLDTKVKEHEKDMEKKEQRQSDDLVLIKEAGK